MDEFNTDLYSSHTESENSNGEMFEKDLVTMKKCGEILINKCENFNYLCIFCREIMKDIEKFHKHIEIYHLELCKQKTFSKNQKKSSSSIIEQRKTTTSTEISNSEPNIEFISFNFIEAKNEPNSPLSTVTVENFNNQLDLPAKNYIDYEDEKEEEKEDDEKYSEKLFSLEQKVSNDPEEVQEIIEKDKLNISSDRKKRKNDINEYFNDSKDILQNSFKYQNTIDNSFDENDLIDEETNKKFECRYCKKNFTNRKNQRQHEILHTGEKNYKCDICDKRFHRKYHVNSHIKIHKNERHYKCELCTIAFNDRSNLTVHMRQHNNDRRFECKYCNKIFGRKANRDTHQRTHTGERPFQCTECGICLISASALKSHFNFRHAINKPYNCKYCERPFSGKREKDEHERIHTGEKPFICEVCSRLFRTGRALKNHLKNRCKKVE